MHKDTEKDLKRLKNIEKEIYELEEEKRKIKKKCKHLDTKVNLVETLAWEYTPMRVCRVCGHWSKNNKPTKEEAMLAYREEFHWISDEELKEALEQGGFNLPRF